MAFSWKDILHRERNSKTQTSPYFSGHPQRAQLLELGPWYFPADRAFLPAAGLLTSWVRTHGVPRFLHLKMRFSCSIIKILFFFLSEVSFFFQKFTIIAECYMANTVYELWGNCTLPTGPLGAAALYSPATATPSNDLTPRNIPAMCFCLHAVVTIKCISPAKIRNGPNRCPWMAWTAEPLRSSSSSHALLFMSVACATHSSSWLWGQIL